MQRFSMSDARVFSEYLYPQSIQPAAPNTNALPANAGIAA